MANKGKHQLLYQNLKLLIATYEASDTLKSLLCKDMFEVPNKSGFQHVVCFLLSILKNDKYESRIRSPIISRQHERDFHDAIYSFIKELRLEFPEARLPVFARSTLKFPFGNLIVNLLLNLSTFVMITCLKRNNAADDLILYPKNNHNLELNLSSLSCFSNAQFVENISKLTRFKQCIDKAFSEITLHISYLDTLINDKHKWLLTILEDEFINPVLKQQMLDVNDDTAIKEKTLDIERRWVRIIELMTKLVQYEQQVEHLYSIVVLMEGKYILPVILDGSMLCAPPLSTDSDSKLKMLISRYKEGDMVVLHTFLEICKHCLKLRENELHEVAIQDGSCILPCLTDLSLKYQEIEVSFQNTLMIINEQHDQLIQEDEPVIMAKGTRLLFQATPPMTLFTTEFTTEQGNSIDNLPKASYNQKVFYTLGKTINVQSAANLLMSNYKGASNVTNTSLRKQSQNEGKDIVSVRKRMSIMRQDLQRSMVQKHLQYAEWPLNNSKHTSAHSVNKTDQNVSYNFPSDCSSTKESPTLNLVKTPVDSKFVINAALKRRMSHDHITVTSKLSSPCFQDERMLDVMVQEMLQDIAKFEGHNIINEDNVSFLSDTSETSSHLHVSPVNLSGIEHLMPKQLPFNLNPLSHPIFQKEISLDSNIENSSYEVDIDQVESLNLCHNIASPVAKSTNLETKNICYRKLMTPPITPTHVNKKSGRKSLDLIIEKFQNVKGNMKEN